MTAFCLPVTGANMLQARMATRVAKPDGLFWLRPDDVASFMLDKKVSDLPGQNQPSTISIIALSLAILPYLL